MSSKVTTFAGCEVSFADPSLAVTCLHRFPEKNSRKVAYFVLENGIIEAANNTNPATETTMNYDEALNNLICDLVDLRRVQTILHDGAKFAVLYFTHCSAIYRWSEDDGFVYGGENR